jgi:hypothetical protein
VAPGKKSTYRHDPVVTQRARLRPFSSLEDDKFHVSPPSPAGHSDRGGDYPSGERVLRRVDGRSPSALSWCGGQGGSASLEATSFLGARVWIAS